MHYPCSQEHCSSNLVKVSKRVNIKNMELPVQKSGNKWISALRYEQSTMRVLWIHEWFFETGRSVHGRQDMTDQIWPCQFSWRNILTVQIERLNYCKHLELHLNKSERMHHRVSEETASNFDEAAEKVLWRSPAAHLTAALFNRTLLLAAEQLHWSGQGSSAVLTAEQKQLFWKRIIPRPCKFGLSPFGDLKAVTALSYSSNWADLCIWKIQHWTTASDL